MFATAGRLGVARGGFATWLKNCRESPCLQLISFDSLVNRQKEASNRTGFHEDPQKMAWLPLESNPDVMNKFLQEMGISEEWKLVDVYGLDEENLGFVPKPVLAVIFLFPCSEKYYNHLKEEQKAIEENGQDVSEDIYYVKQFVSNACGTIALVHTVGNNLDKLELTNETFKKMFEDSKGLSPTDRGNLLQATTEDLIKLHAELAQEGQTELNPSEQVNNHFIALVHKDGNLYELDGRKEFPINHGTTSPETLLEDAAKVCKKFMERDADEVNFTVMALCATQQ